MAWRRKNIPKSTSRQSKISEYFQVTKTGTNKGDNLAFEQIPNIQSEETSDYSDYDLPSTQELMQDKEDVLMINRISDKTDLLSGLIRNYHKHFIVRHQSNINVNIEPVVDWIIQLTKALGYQRKTTHNTCALFFQLLSVMDFHMIDMHLACLACVWISAKLEEYDQYDLPIIMSMCSSEYSSVEICEMEISIYLLLSGLVSCVTFIDFLFPILSEIGETEAYKKACLISDIVLFLEEIMEYTDPEIACGIISIVLTDRTPFQKLASIIKAPNTQNIKKTASIILDRCIKMVSTDKMYKSINNMLKDNKFIIVSLLNQAHQYFNN